MDRDLVPWNMQNWRITMTALEALHSSVETYLVEFLEDSYLCTIHRSRVTLEIKDMLLAKYIRTSHCS